MRATIPIVLIAVTSFIPEARAQDTEEAAVLAADATSEYCADIYGTNVTSVTEGYLQVATALDAVQKAYDDSGDSTLLYWRGVLAQCLGNDEMARTDLGNFVRWSGEEGMNEEELSGLLRDARKRIKRLEAVAGGGGGDRPARAPRRPPKPHKREHPRSAGTSTVAVQPPPPGAVLLVSGCAAAAAGLSMHGAGRPGAPGE